VSFSVGGFDISGAVIALGVVTGMVYGILAVGLVLVYRSSRIINFAHGEIGAFGAALLGVATTKWGVPYWLAFVLAVSVAAGIGGASEVVVIRRLRSAPIVLTAIVTLGLGEIISVFSSLVDRSVGSGITFPQPSGFPRFSIGALLMTPAYSAMVILTPVIVVVLALFLRHGRLGLAMRASAANEEAARIVGILAGRMSALAWAIAGAVAAYTAILVLPTRGFSGGEFLGPGLLLRGLACAVVARLVSLPKALAAGIGLGVVEQLLLANYPSGGQVELAVFAVILVALLAQRVRSGRGEDKGSWATVQPFRPLPAELRRLPLLRTLRWSAAVLALVLGVLVPELTTNATATTFVLIVAFSIVGLSVALVTGMGGQLSLGQFAIAGVGATASYVATRDGAPFALGLAAAALCAAVVSLVVGIPAIRIRGLMLAVTTLGFALAAESWLFQQSWMLGAGVAPRRPAIGGFAFTTGKRYYLVAFVVLVVCLLLAHNVTAGGVGRRIRAVRDNEDAARAFSIPATRVKLQTFMVAGLVAGLGGAVYGHLLAQEAANAFPIDASINAAAVAVVGGLGLLVGPVLGSLYIIGLPRFLPLDNVGLAGTAVGWVLLIVRYPGGVAQAFGPARDHVVASLARRAGRSVAGAADDGSAGAKRATAGPVGAALFPPTLAAGHRRPSDEPILSCEGLTRRFGGVVAVDGVTLSVRSREILGLIGPNGAGKTTLFELLSGFVRADRGRITFGGADVTSLSPEQRAAAGVIRSFQDAALFPTMTVRDVVMLALERSAPTRFGPALLGARGADRRKTEQASALMASLGLERFADRQVQELSTGTRRITELACMIALEPKVLLLDEPTSGIAQREAEALGALLCDLNGRLGITMVVIEHDIPLMMSIAKRVVAMESGKVISVGSPAAVRTDPKVIESYLGGDVRAIARSGRSRAGQLPKRAKVGVR
jgi:ABC-type branched-subunit amino acid transport system ATPase component/ABC-type branched-subunit amino acid transport system permease subunit